MTDNFDEIKFEIDLVRDYIKSDDPVKIKSKIREIFGNDYSIETIKSNLDFIAHEDFEKASSAVEYSLLMNNIF